ncbi:hypothetical protein X759_34275 [Mesorhizobium sp. LSHC420B00]|nr:hypothetical protein X759_34275 [Mesorhizobium sp. LSHC420B00]
MRARCSTADLFSALVQCRPFSQPDERFLTDQVMFGIAGLNTVKTVDEESETDGCA